MKEFLTVVGCFAGMILIALFIAIIVGMIGAIPVYFIYKWFLVGIFDLPMISYWVWVGIIAIIKIIIPTGGNK